MSENSSSDSLIAIQHLKAYIGEHIIGQDVLVERMLIALLADGHILVEGAPGLAKTRAINALSKGIQADFHRVQFTPDLLPADLTGTEIYRPELGNFEFQKGPLFHNLVLADEINRSPAKVQAALLEAMAERQITVGGETYPLPPLFLVMATQNPIEQEGTYPLPEAQLDRFMFNLRIDYPKRSEEIDIVKATTSINHIELNHVINLEELIAFQQLVKNVPVADNVIEYAVDIVGKTRMADERAPKFVKDWLEWGAGPRASSYLILGAKSKAVLEGRTTPDIADVIDMIKPVLRHRVITNFNAESDGIKVDDILDRLIKESK